MLARQYNSQQEGNMSLKKQYLKTKNICRVTFRYPEKGADNVFLVGDFNSWEENSIPMKKNRAGFSTTLELEPGRNYEFRYLVDNQEWANDDEADQYVPSPYPGTENSVVAL